jgi:hypothetical protein
MLEKFKIVKNWYSSAEDSYQFRVYKREMLFFWAYKTTCSTIEQAKHAIASWIEKDQKEKQSKKAIPKDEVVYTV